MLSLLCTSIPRKLPRTQKRNTFGFRSPANKSNYVIVDSYGKDCNRAAQNIMLVCGTDPENTYQLIEAFLFVWPTTGAAKCLRQETSITTGDIGLPAINAHGQCEEESYAINASWQLLRCGKNTQFFHEGVSCVHNTFKLTEDIVPTEKDGRRIVFKTFLGHLFKVWRDFCLNKQYTKKYLTLKRREVFQWKSSNILDEHKHMA